MSIVPRLPQLVQWNIGDWIVHSIHIQEWQAFHVPQPERDGWIDR